MTRNRTADPQTVSDRLKQLRKEKGIKTQAELQKLTGIPLISIKRYESGGTIPEDPNLSKLASFYRVDSAWILGKSDFRNIWEQYDQNHSEDVKTISSAVRFMEIAEALGLYNSQDPDSDEDFYKYVEMYEERKNAMKTRKDITVITGSDENRIIDNFETGEIIIQAVTEEDVEKGFQQLIRRGMINE